VSVFASNYIGRAGNPISDGAVCVLGSVPQVAIAIPSSVAHFIRLRQATTQRFKQIDAGSQQLIEKHILFPYSHISSLAVLLI
jgi:hypothetical protein